MGRGMISVKPRAFVLNARKKLMHNSLKLTAK